MKCKSCGKINSESAVYCLECGDRLKRFGEFSGNRIIDTIIWIVVVVLIVGLFNGFVLGPLLSLL